MRSAYSQEATSSGSSAFFDEGKLVVVVNGFQKKTQKTLAKDLEKALRIKAEYESEK